MTIEDLIIAGVGLIVFTSITTVVGMFIKDRFSKKTVYKDDIPEIVNNILAARYISGELIKKDALDGLRLSIEKEYTTKLYVEEASKENYKMSKDYIDSHINSLHSDHRALHDDINTKFSEVHTKIDDTAGKLDTKIDELKTLIIQQLGAK